MHNFPECSSAPGRKREELREPSGFSVRGLPNRRRLNRGRGGDRARSRTGHRDRGARSQPSSSISPLRIHSAPVQVRTARPGRLAPDRGSRRHRHARRRVRVESTCSSSRWSCPSPDRHGRDRIRPEPSAHGAGTAGRHGDPRGRRDNVRRGGWADVRGRASRRTASTPACPPGFSRYRRPSMTGPRLPTRPRAGAGASTSRTAPPASTRPPRSTGPGGRARSARSRRAPRAPQRRRRGSGRTAPAR